MDIIQVDDAKQNLIIIENWAIKAGFKIKSFLNPSDALQYSLEHNVDLAIVDYMMPEMNGIELIKRLREKFLDIPIIMITAVNDDMDIKLQALQAGATEFLNKPLNQVEFLARFKNLVKLRDFQIMLKDKTKLLEQEVVRATANIVLREHETLHVLGKAAEYKDPETGGHILRVANYCKLLARMSGMDVHQQEIIYFASPLHDIGKLGVPDNILLKPGKLTPEEFDIMKRHTTIGAQILERTKSKYLEMGHEIALSHHEKYNGQGYPHALKGENIPISGRIVAVVDVFDALTTKRPYKEPWSLDASFNYIEQEVNSHFDPRIAEIFLNNREEVEHIFNNYNDQNDNY